jgi:NodT family efflux transporter outer membrane factor (OMF) lipoprotein
MSPSPLRCVGLGLAAATLAACTSVGPDYALPKDSAFTRAQERAAPFDGLGSSAVAPGQAAMEGDWWKLYDDPRLDALVERALRANAELRVAAARLQQAQARYAEARAAGGPDENVEASVARGRVSAESLLQTEPLPIFNFATGGISVSYQFDLFGRIRRGVEAAKANAEAVQAAGDLARISVAAAVVGAYVEICHGNHEIGVARHSLQLQQRSRDVATRLQAAGRGTSVDVARADAQVATLQAALPTWRAQARAAGYKLAALLGVGPDQVPAEAMQCAEAPELKQPIPVGDGAQLLRRRPDMRRAERELAAATAEVGVATAALYPDIRLGASLGANGLLDDFGKSVTQEWSIGPLISWSVPGNGAHARVAAAKAGSEAALAKFDHVVLEALRETQTVLDRYAEDLRHEAALRVARDHAEVAAADERSLYQAGRRPYLSSLDAERTLASADAALASASAQVSQDQIRLFLALGGGWRGGAAAVPAATPAAATSAVAATGSLAAADDAAR